jgi:hypothetical protein
MLKDRQRLSDAARADLDSLVSQAAKRKARGYSRFATMRTALSFSLPASSTSLASTLTSPSPHKIQ